MSRAAKPREHGGSPPHARATYPLRRYELAFSTLDLLGTAEDHLSHWHEGLRFGFSFTANDGDKAAKQTGCVRTTTTYTPPPAC